MMALGLLSCKSEKPAAPGPAAKDGKGGDRAALVDALVAVVTTSPVQVTGAGTLLPTDEIDLKAEASGRITVLGIKEGRRVEAGTLLAKIDDALLQAQKAKLVSQVHRFESLEARKRQQLSLQSVSQQDVDLALADLEAAKADLQVVQVQIRNTEVRAPFAGRIGLREVSVGQVVSIGQILGRLTRMRPLRVELSIPEGKSVGLKEGSSLKFRVLGRLDEFTARVDAVEPRLDPATRTLKIRASYNGPVELIPGSSVTITLDEGSRAGIFVPSEALSGDARGALLFLFKAGVVRSARVVIGLREANRIEVLSGIQAGDTILVAGATRVGAGKPVKINRIIPSP